MTTSIKTIDFKSFPGELIALREAHRGDRLLPIFVNRMLRSMRNYQRLSKLPADTPVNVADCQGHIEKGFSRDLQWLTDWLVKQGY